MRALAYLLSARALDVASDAGDGTRGTQWPKPNDELSPLASTDATAAAWRRWRDEGPGEAARDAAHDAAGDPKTTGQTRLRRALRPAGI